MMDVRLQIFLCICCCGFIGLCLQLLRKGAMEYKYALLWLVGSVVMLLCVLVPGPLFAFARLVGIIDPVNMVFFIAFFLTLMIIFALSIIVSRLSTRIRQLAQAIALLEKRVLDDGSVPPDTLPGAEGPPAGLPTQPPRKMV